MRYQPLQGVASQPNMVLGEITPETLRQNLNEFAHVSGTSKVVQKRQKKQVLFQWRLLVHLTKMFRKKEEDT